MWPATRHCRGVLLKGHLRAPSARGTTTASPSLRGERDGITTPTSAAQPSPGVNVGPDPGPTEETLIAAAVAQAAKRDDGQILADTSIIPPSFHRDHPDPEVRVFYTGTRLNPRSVDYAAGLGRGPVLNRGHEHQKADDDGH